MDLETARAEFRLRGLWGHPKVSTYLNIAADEFPEKVALVDPRGMTLAFGEYRRSVDAFASALRAAGLRKGDVVAVQLPNWIEFCIAHLALVRCGMVTLFLPPAQRGSDLRYILGCTKPSLFVIPASHRSGKHLEMYSEFHAELGNQPGIVVGAESADGLPEGMTTWERFIETGAGDATEEPVELGDPQLMVFSSGTTANPKGVLHSYGTGDYHIHVWRQLLAFGHEDVIFSPATLGHVAGSQFGLRLATLLGAKLVLMDRWDPEEAMRLIEQEGATYSFVRRPSSKTCSRHRTCGRRPTGPSASGRSAARGSPRARDRVRGSGRRQGIAGIRDDRAHDVVALVADDPLEKRIYTDGRTLPGCEYRIVDPEDSSRTLPSGEVGGAAYRGPALVDGYFTERGRDRKDVRRRLAAVGGSRRPRRGRLHDHRRPQEGHDHSRRREHFPLELENLIVREPDAVAEVAVVRYPDRRLGERVCAVVVPASGATVTLEEINAFLTDHDVSRYKHPERLEIVNELPRSNIGKVVKRVLEERFEKEAAASASSQPDAQQGGSTA